MQRKGLRITVGGVDLDVQLATFVDQQLLQYDAASGTLRGVNGVVLVGTPASGDAPVFNGTSYVPKQRGYKTLAGQFSLTSATPVAVGLQVALPRAGTYIFDATLFVTQSANTVVGYGINASANFTSCSFMGLHPRGAGAAGYGARTTANNTANTDTRSTAALTLPAQLYGHVVVSGACNLDIVAQRATVNTVTVEAGSGLSVYEL